MVDYRFFFSVVLGFLPLMYGSVFAADRTADGVVPAIQSSRDSEPLNSHPGAETQATTVPWDELTDVPTRKVQHRVVPRFTARQFRLHHKVQRFHGYMVPLGPETLQHRFLLRPTPGCDECDETEVEQTIEVTGRVAIPYSAEPVTVEGVFTLQHDHPHGLFYRLENAVRLD